MHLISSCCYTYLHLIVSDARDVFPFVPGPDTLLSLFLTQIVKYCALSYSILACKNNVVWMSSHLHSYTQSTKNPVLALNAPLSADSVVYTVYIETISTPEKEMWKVLTTNQPYQISNYCACAPFPTMEVMPGLCEQYGSRLSSHATRYVCDHIGIRRVKRRAPSIGLWKDLIKFMKVHVQYTQADNYLFFLLSVCC